MNNKESIEEYIYSKILISIIFDVNHESYNYEENSWIFDTKVLEDIKVIIEYYCYQGYLNLKIKNNVYNYLNEARNIKSDDYKDRIKLINEIITELNKSSDYTYHLFYSIELFKRRNNRKYLYKYNIDIIDKEIPLVNKSLIYDSLVLISHNNRTSDKKFVEEWLPSLTENLFYYESISAILKEYPEIFKDQTFYNRFICVLNANNELSENASYKVNKKLVKLVNKEIKKV